MCEAEKWEKEREEREGDKKIEIKKTFLWVTYLLRSAKFAIKLRICFDMPYNCEDLTYIYIIVLVSIFHIRTSYRTICQ